MDMLSSMPMAFLEHWEPPTPDQPGRRRSSWATVRSFARDSFVDVIVARRQLAATGPHRSQTSPPERQEYSSADRKSKSSARQRPVSARVTAQERGWNPRAGAAHEMLRSPKPQSTRLSRRTCDQREGTTSTPGGAGTRRPRTFNRCSNSPSPTRTHPLKHFLEQQQQRQNDDNTAHRPYALGRIGPQEQQSEPVATISPEEQNKKLEEQVRQLKKQLSEAQALAQAPRQQFRDRESGSSGAREWGNGGWGRERVREGDV